MLRSSAQPKPNTLQLPRTLIILLNLVKELSTGRLQRTRTNLQAVSPEIFQVLGQVYLERIQRWRSFLEKGGDDEGGAMEAIEQSLLALKVLRRLLVLGYEFPNRHKEVQEFWSLTGAQFTDFLSIAMQHAQITSEQVQKLVGKHLLQLSKLHLDMAKTHPAAFALFHSSIDLGRAYWSLIFAYGETLGSEPPNSAVNEAIRNLDVEDGQSLVERLSLKGLLILRACLKMVFNPTQSFKYQHAEDKAERKDSIQRLRSQLLTDELACEIMQTVVTRYFVLRPNDLREWKEEPEEWESSEAADLDIWEYSIRSCSEKILLDLLLNFKELLVQRLLNVFYSVSRKPTMLVCVNDPNSNSAAQQGPSAQGLYLRGHRCRCTNSRNATRLRSIPY